MQKTSGDVPPPPPSWALVNFLMRGLLSSGIALCGSVTDTSCFCVCAIRLPTRERRASLAMMWADLPVVVERRSGGRQELIQVIHRDAVSGQTGRVCSFRSDWQGLGQGSSEV